MQIKNVGIRAHTIQVASEITSNGRNDNVYKCWLNFTSETPSRMTVYLSMKNETLGQGNYHIQWEITKQAWFEIKDKPQPWNLRFDPDHLIII